MAFDCLPIRQHFLGIVCDDITKDMWVPPNELIGYRFKDIRKRKPPVFISNRSMEYNLQGQVPELLYELVIGATVNGINNLVGLFNDQMPYRLVGLLSIPRTLPA